MILSYYLRFFCFSILFSLFTQVYSQIPINAKWGKGISIIAKDSSFTSKFSFRFQSLYVGKHYNDSKSWEESLMIRRCRLKFDGYAFNPKVKYKLELGLSNRDTRSGQVAQSGNTANIILDAVVKYQFAPGWELWAGQTKLPGNRERVVSSQNLQFVDRSYVNSRFTLDRDIGLQLRTSQSFGSFVIREQLAVSAGEGRDVIQPNFDNGKEFTYRVELLPFGEFTSKGDYFGSDLKREDQLKLSIGVTYDFNNNTNRSRGNLGDFMYDEVSMQDVQSDLSTWLIDAILKYKGFSWNMEYANRDTDQQVEGFGYGRGFMTAAGFLFPSNYEVAARYTDVRKTGALSSISDQKEYTLGISRYVVGHALKVQSDISYIDRGAKEDYYQLRVQFEVAL